MFDTLLDFRDDNFAETDSTSSTISDSESVSGSPHEEPNVDNSLTVSNFGLKSFAKISNDFHGPSKNGSFATLQIENDKISSTYFSSIS